MWNIKHYCTSLYMSTHNIYVYLYNTTLQDILVAVVCWSHRVRFFIDFSPASSNLVVHCSLIFHWLLAGPLLRSFRMFSESIYAPSRAHTLIAISAHDHPMYNVHLDSLSIVGETSYRIWVGCIEFDKVLTIRSKILHLSS